MKFPIPIPLPLALCLALSLAACGGETLGSRPVTVPAASSPAGSAPAAIPGVKATEAGVLYLDVTEEMYATGRYGEKPSAASCISADQAAGLAAQYAKSFVDYDLTDSIWKLNLGQDELLVPGQPLWLCKLSLPKWSEHPELIPDDPVLRALTPEQLAWLDEQYHTLDFSIDAVSGELLSGYASLPSEGLIDLVMGSELSPEALQLYEEARVAWCARPETAAAVSAAFSGLCGQAPAGALLSDSERSYEISDPAGNLYVLQPQYPTGLLVSFRLEYKNEGGNEP